MARPRGPRMLARRLRAFELYSSGIKPIEIARELGVTRQTVSYWSRQDKWDVRLSEVIHRAEEALSHVLGDQVAHILKSLRARMGARVGELEGLCQSRNEHVRLKAITAWLKLAGVDQAVPSPTDPTNPRSLELIEDLVEKTAWAKADEQARDHPGPLTESGTTGPGGTSPTGAAGIAPPDPGLADPPGEDDFLHPAVLPGVDGDPVQQAGDERDLGGTDRLL